MSRADRHNNPAAITTDLAKQAGLELGKDYEQGDAFPSGAKLHTATLIGDPVELTIRVIDKLGFYTTMGAKRWEYIALPKFVWDSLVRPLKIRVIGFMYKREGGTELTKLFGEGG